MQGSVKGYGKFRTGSFPILSQNHLKSVNILPAVYARLDRLFFYGWVTPS